MGGALKSPIVEIPVSTIQIVNIEPSGTITARIPITRSELDPGQIVLIASIGGSGLLLVSLALIYLPDPGIPSLTSTARTGKAWKGNEAYDEIGGLIDIRLHLQKQ
jgi:hypothetical protein